MVVFRFLRLPHFLRRPLGFLLLIPSFIPLIEASADDWAIIVDTQPFPSAEAAARGETSVSWQDRDAPAAIACTLGYAALELRDHLRRIVAEADEQSFVLLPATSPPPEYRIHLATLEQLDRHDALAGLLNKAHRRHLRSARGAFVILPRESTLYIIGADRTGTLYGAYAFLESLGVRWYGPEAHEIHLPERVPFALPSETILSAPSFATRGFWVREDKGNLDFYRWMARNRMNYWSIAEPNRAFLHKLGMHLTFGGHHYWEKYMAAEAPYPFDHVGFEGDEALPPDPYAAPSTAFQGDVDGDSRLTFFEARPEWYGLDEDGVRTSFEGMYGMNVCTSNPDPLHYIYSQIVSELAHGEWQDVDSLNFWSIDNGDWCQCEPCSAVGEPTDRLMLMVHGLDQAVDAALDRGELKRSIKIIFPIYQKTITAPTRPLPADFDYTTNIGTFFPIRRCYVHSIDDPNCTEFNTARWHAFQDWTQAEDRHYRGEIFVGEYFNVSVNKSLPVIYPNIIQTDIPKYYAAGARHMHYMHTDTRLLGVKRINNFLFARILWDVSADLSGEIEDYFTHLYGPVASTMREVYRLLEFAHSNTRQMRYWDKLPTRIAERTFPLFYEKHFQLEKTTPERDDGVDLAESVAAFRELRKIMDTVLEQKLPERIRQRLLIDDQTIRYGENTVIFYDAVARAVIAEHEGNLTRARAEFERSIPYARALKAETEVVKTATNHHVHARDGLDASRIEEAYRALGKRLNLNLAF